MPYLRLSRAALGSFIIVFATVVILGQTTSSISGRVKDPTGAVIPSAQVTLSSSGSEARTTTTDARGQFRIDNVAPGTYRISVSRSGFKIAEQNVDVSNRRNATLDIDLALEPITAEVDVSSKGVIRANADPVYRHLRQDMSFETYSVSNLTITKDVGTFTLKSGRLSFRKAIEGRFVNAVFTGEGEFSLKPVLGIERDYLRFVTEKDDVAETFDKLVLCFTDNTYEEIKKQATAAEPDNRAADVFQDFHKRVRSRSDRPRSIVEYLFANEGIENIDAETLADIYNPNGPGFFMAFMNGKPFGDLRYIVRPRGAIPQILSPEEVALINYDPLGEREGILYLSHSQKELQANQASSEEDKRIIDVQHYRIETVVDGEKLIATAEIEFTAMADGDRILNFGLLPSLRVNRVTFGNSEIQYVQEDRKQDGAFYAILPERLVKGKSYKINIDYDGNKVLEDQGGGNFAVGARTS
jgi:Carboxypeptidase regulatory-like domain